MDTATRPAPPPAASSSERDTGTRGSTVEPDTGEVLILILEGQEHEEREDKRKTKKIAATEAASTRTGTVITMPFGVVDDVRAMRLSLSLSVNCDLCTK